MRLVIPFLVLFLGSACSESIPPLDTGADSLDTASEAPDQCSPLSVTFEDSEAGFSFCMDDSLSNLGGFRHNGAGIFPVRSFEPIEGGIQVDFDDGSQWWSLVPGVSAERLDIEGYGLESWYFKNDIWYLIIHDYNYVE